METRHLEVEVAFEEGAAILKMRGEIDGFASGTMNDAYDEAESTDPKRIVLDFTEVVYINSTGIALIVSVLAKARAAKRELIACGLSDHYVEIFTITRLSDFMQLVPDYEASQRVCGSEDQRPEPTNKDEGK